MNIIRTPEERFENLTDYPFSPHYLQLGELRMHYVDEGSGESGFTVLMVHGEPSWSYLYRHMIPICASARHRVIAPDLIGFGKSDKPTRMEDYSYAGHVEWLRQFVDKLDLQNICLVCQDWGSLLGLRLATLMPNRFAAIVVGNGFLPTGEQKVPFVFKAWRAFAVYSPWFPISKIVNSGCFKNLSEDERRAYDAPFPSSRYKAGTRAFPRLVPTEPDALGAEENQRAWRILQQWQKPFLTTFSNGDPIMRGGDRYFQERVPGAKGQPHVTLKGGHFLQEDAGPEFATEVNRLLDRMAE
ncbi:haloalkane dehalogenase [Hahella sp. CCB-MM4]|uniref:haloalkane dehalogenase n=1 Tax=Hahella sp. (strain CCB-MM4) TaxID=1926491 RepID=UPI000B9B5AF5|nr:haloalkane dehalogenase [Hahella sp. CCB-MM4]OZG75335.1 haloalkane dehalogenase [Hahella sp. CCB-MM4]